MSAVAAHDLHRVIRTQRLSDDHCQYFIYQVGAMSLFERRLTATDPPSTQGAPLGRRPAPRSKAVQPPAQCQLRSQGESNTRRWRLFIPASSATLASRGPHDRLQTSPTTAARS
jgi:hypothetical protein